MAVLEEKNSLKVFEQDLAQKKKIYEMVCQTPGYSKIPKEGIWPVMQMADSLGISYASAFGGGLYFVRGNIEMSSKLMNHLIRSRGHSVRLDPKSDDKVCILHGKRADNGDTWTVDFSIDEAKRAGLLSNPSWGKYPKDMLFARALSRLARQLFADVIGGCYIEGEIDITKTPEIAEKPELAEAECEIEEKYEKEEEKITLEHLEQLNQMLDGREDFKQRIMVAYNVKCLSSLDDKNFTVIKSGIDVLKKREMTNAKVAKKEAANEGP